MSNNKPNTPASPSELDLLKNRADQLGIKYYSTIGTKKLRAMVDDAMNGKPIEVAAPVPEEAVMEKLLINESDADRRTRLRAEAGRLVRVRVACMNPSKKDWEGEVYTVGNSVVGSFKKFVPFNNEAGWHVPYIIYQHMKERECQIFQTVKNDRGNRVRKGKLIKELAIEVLDALTPIEIEELKAMQAATHSIG